MGVAGASLPVLGIPYTFCIIMAAVIARIVLGAWYDG